MEQNKTLKKINENYLFSCFLVASLLVLTMIIDFGLDGEKALLIKQYVPISEKSTLLTLELFNTLIFIFKCALMVLIIYLPIRYFKKTKMMNRMGKYIDGRNIVSISTIVTETKDLRGNPVSNKEGRIIALADDGTLWNAGLPINPAGELAWHQINKLPQE